MVLHEPFLGPPKKQTLPLAGRVSVCRKSAHMSNRMQEPRRVPSSADDGIKSNLFFPGTCASEKTLLRPQVWNLAAPDKLCAQRPASLRKNACIFERACRLCRQAQTLPLAGRVCFFVRRSDRDLKSNRRFLANGSPWLIVWLYIGHRAPV